MENNTASRTYLTRKVKEKLFLGAILLCSLIVVVPLISILAYVGFQGILSVNWQLFTQLPTPVGVPGGGMANAFLGTLILVVLASLMGLPIGILGGVWLAEYGKGKRGFLVRYAADVLSGIPSIVIGIFVYALLVLPLHHFSAFAGGFALALIMIPTVARTTEELVRLVPTALRESALALGIPQWRVTLSIVLRTAWNGIFTGVMLAIARITGETAPLLFTSFNNQYWNISLNQPMASLTVQIFNYSISPFDDWHAKAWAGSLALILFVLLITMVVRKFSQKIRYA